MVDRTPLVASDGMAAGKDGGAHAPPPRPDIAVITREWDAAVAVSMKGLHNVPLCSKLGFILNSLLLVVVAIVVFSVLYVEKILPVAGIAVGIPVSVVVLPVLGYLMTKHCQFYAPKPSGRPRSSPVNDGGNMPANHSLPYRSTRVRELVTTPEAGVFTLKQLWERNVRLYGDNNCMGKRDKIKTIKKEVTLTRKSGEVETKTFTKLILGPEFHWQTYKQVHEDVKAFSNFLSARMDEAVPAGGDRPRHAGIYASTSPHWQQIAQACFRANVPLATVYATLGADGLAYAAHLTDVSLLIVEPETIGHLAKVMTRPWAVDDGAGGSIACSNLAHIRTVLVINGARSDCDAATVSALESRSAELGGPIKIVDAAAALAEGRRAPARDVEEGGGAAGGGEPAADDTAVIMFTSGSTGLPKGVKVLHRNLVGAVGGLSTAVPGFNSGDVFIAYLPLAHILELAAELSCLSVGGALGYGSPFTLTATSPMVAQVGDHPDVPPEGVLGDAAALRPTVLAGVPAVYDKVRKGLTKRFSEATGLRKTLWDAAIETKSRLWPEYGLTPFFDGMLFDKVRAIALGGRVRVMISGGGPIAKETQLFMNVVFNCPLGQGYGLTETCGGGTVFWPDDRSLGRAGVPIPSNDIKLVDWEEGGYTVRPNEKSSLPQGEVCIAGSNVTAGYYLNEEKTRESFVEEGGRVWFYTGDIGQFDADGWLRIIDRKKDLVKLIRGEYIALGKIETVAKLADSVINLCAYGDSMKEYCVAVAVVNKDALPAPYNTMDEEDLIGNAAVADIVQKEVAAKGKGKLSKEEVPAKIYIVGTQEWTPPSGLVTASLKYQRRTIYKTFEREIDILYGKAPGAAGSD